MDEVDVLDKNGKPRPTHELQILLQRAIEQKKDYYVALIRNELKRRVDPDWEKHPAHPF